MHLTVSRNFMAIRIVSNKMSGCFWTVQTVKFD